MVRWSAGDKDDRFDASVLTCADWLTPKRTSGR